MEPKIINADELIGATKDPQPAIADNTTLEQLLRVMLTDQAERLQEKQQTKARLAEAKAQLRAEVAKANRDKELRQLHCTHTMPKGENAIFGQVHGDGKYHPICVVCQKEFPPRAPRGSEIETNVEMAS